MEVTCLSKGNGFHFPPCHLLKVEGLTVLLNCPLDLSTLKIFSPLPPRMNDSILSQLIFEKPWYKTVTNLHLWDPCLIDIVLISSTMGLLGLPFLTRIKGFSAKVYVTEATARIGKLLMEELVSMHNEFIKFYGTRDSEFPTWMKWEFFYSLPSYLRDVACGKDGEELGGWLPLYSSLDAQECIQKLHMLKYNEETTFNGILVINPFSCGSEIGSCNWSLTGPHGSVACIACSSISSAFAMEFDHQIFEKRDLILITSFHCDQEEDDYDSTKNNTFLRDLEFKGKEVNKQLKNSETEEKLAFISTCCLDTVKAGGSVLLPLYNIGIILQLMQLLVNIFESSTLKVPIYFVSSKSEEILAAVNIMPEWLSSDQQEKMFSGEQFCVSTEGSKSNKFCVFSSAHSPQLLNLASFFAPIGLCALVLLFIFFNISPMIQTLYLFWRMM